MKKFNWVALPGIIVSSYFIYIGVTKLSDDILFACIWLFLSGTALYRSLMILLNRSIKKIVASENNSHNGVEKRLKELDNLYDQGLITRAELEENRNNILKEI